MKNNINTIYKKSYITIDNNGSLKDCNSATDPHYLYVVRSTALNRPSNPITEFQMFILQAIWYDGLFQLGISPVCDFIVLRRYSTNETQGWSEWYKASLVTAT